MTAPTWPVVHICRCGRLRQEHLYRPATKTLDARWCGTDDAACLGYTQARVEERPPASELQRRLDAVATLPGTPPRCPDNLELLVERMAYEQGWYDAQAFAKRAARGET